MKFFENYYNDVDFYKDGAEEIKVLCPFHSDTNPSASINVKKELFHCWVCGVGYNEQQFISKINDISLVDASKVLSNLEGTKNQEWSVVHQANLWTNKDILNVLYSWGLTNELIETLKLGLVKDKLENERLGIPVFYNKVLMETRSYDIMKKSGIKMMADKNAENGHVIPYDSWMSKKDEPTYLFEGEKDMLVALGLGLNAITLTGGADAVPNDMTINAFKDRDIIICYDNDDAGRKGQKGVYFAIKNVAKSVKYINISDVVKNNKEDFTDAVLKYDMTLWDFLLLETHEFKNVEKDYITIKEALNKNIIKKSLISEITVNGEFEDTFAVPTMVTITKKEMTGSKTETMVIDEVKTWYLEKQNVHHMLSLIETDAKKAQVITKIMGFLGIGAKEQGIDIKIGDYITIFKSRISDLTSDGGKLDIYSFAKLDVGHNYDLTYKIYPHPTKHQKLVVLATHIEELNGFDNFQPNKGILQHFQKGETIEDKLQHLYESAKYYVAPHLDRNLWLTTDLTMNSVYEFDYNDRIKGTLDIFVLGDTQVGKSETSSKLVDLYNMGKFLSLKTSTTVGLIGGSNKVDGNWLNTIGAIPRQHKGFVCMEEFSGAKPEFIKTMTDVRSSGRLRLARAAGELDVACRLRMLTLSNAINDDQGNPRDLKSFPNGIMPLMELIKSAEDVARYDGFYLISKPETRFNPFGVKLTDNPIPKEYYTHKLMWAWSRTPEQVVFEKGVKSYIWDKSNDLNKLFECNFPIFGTTTPLKLARYSVALASLIVSTDETYENVIISKEIVDEAFSFIVETYDNDLFKLKEYKQEYDSYSKINTEDLKELQKLYSRNSTLFEWINNSSQASRNDLQTISGLKGDDFNPLFNRMVSLKLVRISGTKVFPTPKFRIGMRKIDKTLVHDTGQTMIDLNSKVGG